MDILHTSSPKLHTDVGGLLVVVIKKKTPGCVVNAVVKCQHGGFVAAYLSCMSKDIQTLQLYLLNVMIVSTAPQQQRVSNQKVTRNDTEEK